MARSLNKVMLIGNMTRDPEMRYTPQGTAVCTFGIATNRNWTTDTGEKKEEADFHNIVAWGKLAEICTNILKKGRKVFVEGRLSTQSWQGSDGVKKQKTEVIISDMLALDKKGDEAGQAGIDIPEPTVESQVPQEEEKPASAKATAGKGKKEKEEVTEEPTEEDIPF